MLQSSEEPLFELQSGYDGEEILEFFCPEAVDSDERMAPPRDDYPIGCTVELHDKETVMRQQTAELWTPIMHKLCQQRLPGQILRHSGDYSYAIFNVPDEEMTCGVTLFRACFKEPRVRFKRAAENAVLNNSVVPENEWSEPAANTTLVEVHPNTPPVATSPNASQTLLPPGLNRSLKRNMKEGGRKCIHRGNRAFKDGQFTDAIRHYTMAIEMFSDGDELHRALCNRSAVYAALRDFPRALQDAMDAIKYDESSIKGFIRAAQAFMSMKKYRDAARMFEKAMNLDLTNRDVIQCLQSARSYAFFSCRTDLTAVEIVMHITSGISLQTRKRQVPGDILLTSQPIVSFTIGDSPACHLCAKPLDRKERILEFFKSKEAKTFILGHYPEPNKKQCPHGCGAIFCDGCVNVAWSLFHSFECSAIGSWKGVISCLAAEGVVTLQMRILIRLLALLASGFLTSHPHPRDMEKSTTSHMSSSSTFVRPPEGTSQILEGIAVLQSWLPPMSAMQWNISHEEQRMVTILHRLLSSQLMLNAAEAHEFTCSLVMQLYCVVSSHSITRTCSTWPAFINIVQAHLGLLDVEHRFTYYNVLFDILHESAAIESTQSEYVGLFDFIPHCLHHSPTSSTGNAVVSNELSQMRAIQLRVTRTVFPGERISVAVNDFV